MRPIMILAAAALGGLLAASSGAISTAPETSTALGTWVANTSPPSRPMP